MAGTPELIGLLRDVQARMTCELDVCVLPRKSHLQPIIPYSQQLQTFSGRRKSMISRITCIDIPREEEAKSGAPTGFPLRTPAAPAGEGRGLTE